MAKASNTSAPKQTFYEIIFKGPPKIVFGFLSGLVLGVGEEATVFYNLQEKVYHEGLGEKIAEMIHIRSKDMHVILDNNTTQRIKKLSKKIHKETGIEISSCRNIRSAELRFKFEVFALKYDKEVMDTLQNLPQGVKLVDFEREEHINPEAEGIEGYAPAHHYEIKGRGALVGRIDRIIELRRKIEKHPQIKPKLITLNLA